MEDLVSVVIPCYNVEKYLEKCIKSILNQNYENLEIIIVNDGSPDNCYQIIEEFTKKDSRIIAIHQKNGGLSNARNNGIRRASGKYITFIDSDDYINKYMISEMVKAIKKYNVNLVQCDFEYVYADSEDKSNDYQKDSNISILDKNEIFETRRTKITASAKLFLTDLVKKHKFEEGKINEDEFFTYKLLYESETIALLNSSLYYYYQSDNSITRNNEHYIKLDFLDAYKERIEYFKKNNENRLCDISKKEYLIRLALSYIKVSQDVDNTNDNKIFIDEFNKYYFDIKYCKFEKKEKIFLSLFNFSPKIFSFFLGRFKK